MSVRRCTDICFWAPNVLSTLNGEKNAFLGFNLSEIYTLKWKNLSHRSVYFYWLPKELWFECRLYCACLRLSRANPIPNSWEVNITALVRSFIVVVLGENLFAPAFRIPVANLADFQATLWLLENKCILLTKVLTHTFKICNFSFAIFIVP